MQFRLLLFVAAVGAVSAIGCQSERYDAIYDKKVERLAEGIKDKSEAAELLQSIIRNSYQISVSHRGFWPDARPPCPPPSWSPKEALEVNESRIMTTYWRQHWIGEETISKTAYNPAGYGHKMWLWKAYKGPKTFHIVEIPFDRVSRISTGKPAFSKCVFVKVYYRPEDSEEGASGQEKLFKVWLPDPMFGECEKNRCLAALSKLCSHL